MSVNNQCSYWFLTIHDNAKCFNEIDNILNKLINDNPNIEYSYIKHNIDSDDNCIHYHLVLYFKGKVKRFTTIQTLFDGAHIEQTNRQRYQRCIQYLIHKNNPQKQQYDINEIVSNIDKPCLYDIIQSVGYEFILFDETKIFDYMTDFYNKYHNVNINQFITTFGLSALRQYYFIIKDLIKEFNNDIYKFERSLPKEYRDFFSTEYQLNLKYDFNVAKKYHYIDDNMDFAEFCDLAYQNYIDMH